MTKIYPPATYRLLTLDAMRGVAALLVLVYHFRDQQVYWARSGYLAVDFFFILSGFVINRAYAGQDITGAAFAKLRFIRLYPIFLAGLAFGVIQHVWHSALESDRSGSMLERAPTILDFAFNLLVVPSPNAYYLFPWNGPAWTLFFELIANIVYGFFLIRCRLSTLALWLCVCTALLILAVFNLGTVNGGWAWVNFYIGILRVAVGFLAGVCLAQACTAPARPSWAFLIPIAVLIATLTIPPVTGKELIQYELTVVLILSPALVWLGSRFSPPHGLKRSAALLGMISYPLYSVHHPLLFIAGYCAQIAGAPNRVWMPIYIVAVCVLAVSLAKYWDLPIRKQLVKKFPAFEDRFKASEGAK